MESPEPTFSLEASLLNLFLKHGLEQKRLIFQFPINSGKRPSICQKLLIKRQLCLLPLSSSVPNTTEQVIVWLSTGIECLSGLADKTVQHDRGKKRVVSSLNLTRKCAAVLRLKKGTLGKSRRIGKRKYFAKWRHTYTKSYTWTRRILLRRITGTLLMKTSRQET